MVSSFVPRVSSVGWKAVRVAEDGSYFSSHTDDPVFRKVYRLNMETRDESMWMFYFHESAKAIEVACAIPYEQPAAVLKVEILGPSEEASLICRGNGPYREFWTAKMLGLDDSEMWNGPQLSLEDRGIAIANTWLAAAIRPIQEIWRGTREDPLLDYELVTILEAKMRKDQSSVWLPVIGERKGAFSGR